MAKISDEIRGFVQRSYEDEYMDPKELLALADRVDRELVELPKDADGVPIHVGDTLFNSGKEYVVTCISTDYCDHNFAFYANDNDSIAYNPKAFTHEHPDSLERIADELEKLSESNRINGSGEVFYRAGDLAARIRRLADKEG
jgi:hypothetical protein